MGIGGRMKEIIEGIDCSWYENCIYYKQCERLKQENRELKKRCEELDKMTGIFSARLANKYKQALEEIKEITKKYDAEAGDTIIANPIQDCYDVFIKANEVLNEED